MNYLEFSVVVDFCHKNNTENLSTFFALILVPISHDKVNNSQTYFIQIKKEILQIL